MPPEGCNGGDNMSQAILEMSFEDNHSALNGHNLLRVASRQC